MGKVSKSQWDFGELFPVEATRHVLSVTELTVKVRRLLEGQVGEVWVSGEVTNMRLQSSGHAYFTLKDATSQLTCVLFRSEPGIQRAYLSDGRQVTVRGQLTVYEPRGQYQLRITAVELKGEGALQAAFDRLKKELEAAGLFAPERKRSLPRFPARVGLVTSPTGAAIRDVLHVTARRNPSLEYIFIPCRVQGSGAARELAAAIKTLNSYHEACSKAGTPGLDVILLTRGGGSLEDLWAFNEAELAHAIYNSAVPILSAVGHEIDFTISDFVADARAATPSAAAEILTEGVFSSCQHLAHLGRRLRALCVGRLQQHTESLDRATRALSRSHPHRRLERDQQYVDELQEALRRCAAAKLKAAAGSCHAVRARLAGIRLRGLVDRQHQRSVESARRMREQLRRRLAALQMRLDAARQSLCLLGPEQVLSRGYSITMDARTGEVIRSADEVKPGQVLATQLKNGRIQSKIPRKRANSASPEFPES